MSSPILPIQGPPDLSTATPSVGGDAADMSALMSELATSEATFAPGASRGAPPPEVFDQIAAAGRIQERLCESGQQLRFVTAASGEPTRIEIHDGEGNVVRAVSTIDAFELAAGRGSR